MMRFGLCPCSALMETIPPLLSVIMSIIELVRVLEQQSGLPYRKGLMVDGKPPYVLPLVSKWNMCCNNECCNVTQKVIEAITSLSSQGGLVRSYSLSGAPRRDD